MNAKTLAVISLSACIFAGCADTPENRGLAQALGAGMQSMGQGLADEAAETRRALRENSRQQQDYLPRPTTNCITRYESLTQEYITNCN